MKRTPRSWLFVTLLVVALAAAACGDDDSESTGGDGTTGVESSAPSTDPTPVTDDEAESTDSGTTDRVEDTTPDGSDDVVELTQDEDRGLHIITIGGPLVDPFFSAWEKGTTAAGEDLRVQSDYTAPADFSNVESDLTRLMEAAISQNPDGIVIGDFLPDVQDPGIEEAIAAGIPVVVVNSGERSAKTLGAIVFVGLEDFLTGERTAEHMIATGVTNGLCFDHVPQNPATTKVCEGFVAAFDRAGLESSIFNLPMTDAGDPQAIAAALTGQLSADPDIDGVFTLGTAIAESAMQAIGDLGVSDSVALGSGNLSTNVLNAIIDGDIAFAVDQQPYLQGYYGVLIAVQFVEYGLAPSEPIRTGPFIITSDNAQRVIEIQEATGVRGSG